MLGHLMMSWHLNVWKVKIWLSQKQKELSKWSKKHVSLFHKSSLLNVADTTFNIYFSVLCNVCLFRCIYLTRFFWMNISHFILCRGVKTPYFKNNPSHFWYPPPPFLKIPYPSPPSPLLSRQNFQESSLA